MSTLTDAFEARYSAKRVRDLTLPDNQDSDTADATKLAQAATDAADEFETLCGRTFDATQTSHLRIAVLLMEALLVEWGAGTTSEAKAIRERAKTQSEAVRDVTGRNRILPGVGTTPRAADEPFKDEAMARWRIRGPGSGGRDVDGCGRC